MRRSLKRLIPLFTGIVIVSLAACVSVSTQFPTAQPTVFPTVTPGAPNTSVASADLTNTEWRLVSFTEAGTVTPTLPGSDLSLSFHENGEVDGSGGCNSFGGGYQVQGSNISFQQLIHTDMACTAPGLNEQEQTYLEALQSSVRFERSGDSLKIWYGNGQAVLTFSPGTASIPAQPVPTSTGVAPTLVSPTATTAASASGDVNAARRITFAAGATTATVTGHLEAFETDPYVLRVLAGQTMTVSLTFTSGQAILIIWGADGNVLMSDHAGAASFQQAMPTTQDYNIHVRNRPDGPTDYTMTISIPAPASGEQRIEFAPAATTATVSGQLNASASDRYVLNASAGQTLNIDLTFTEGAAILVVWGEDGNVLLSDHAEASSFQMVLPTTQDYHIMVRGRPEGPTTYTMGVTIPPAT
jgi:heat shock protein HslJ